MDYANLKGTQKCITQYCPFLVHSDTELAAREGWPNHCCGQCWCHHTGYVSKRMRKNGASSRHGERCQGILPDNWQDSDVGMQISKYAKDKTVTAALESPATSQSQENSCEQGIFCSLHSFCQPQSQRAAAAAAAAAASAADGCTGSTTSAASYATTGWSNAATKGSSSRSSGNSSSSCQLQQQRRAAAAEAAAATVHTATRHYAAEADGYVSICAGDQVQLVTNDMFPPDEGNKHASDYVYVTTSHGHRGWIPFEVLTDWC